MSSSGSGPLILVLPVVAWLLTLTLSLGCLVDAWRRKNPAGVAPALGLALGIALTAAAAAPYPARGLVFPPAALLPAVWYWWTQVRPAPDPRLAAGFKAALKQAGLHLILGVGAALFSLPFVWMVLTSLKPDDAIFRDPAALPHPWQWSNYPRAFGFLEIALGHIRTFFGLLFLMNTLEVTLLSTAGMLASSSLTAYAFARIRWPGRDLLFSILLASMMLPAAVTLIPRFLIFRSLGVIDTLMPLWLPSFFAEAFYVFLLRQFLMSIPNELEEAARIDGAGYFTTYWRVMLPLIKPALAAVAIMQILFTWNDFMGPLVYVASPELTPGTYALRLFQSAGPSEWGLLLAAASLWTAPVVLLFFFAQRAFIEGVTLTGMKN